MIVCTLFNPALDLSFEIEKLESGSTLLDLQSHALPSGKGINVARVIKTLGEEVAVTALMPENDSRRFASFLCDQGIEPRFYEIGGSVRINVTMMETKNPSVTHFNSISSSVSLRIQEEFFGFVSSSVKKGDYCCFSGSLPSGVESNIYSRAIKMCTDIGAETLLDTRGDPLKLGVRSKPLIIKPNITELEEYFGEPVQGVHHMALKGKRFIDMGISYVFISLGADGMIALHGNDCLLCSPPQVKTVDTVGCGDALVAGLIVARKRNFSFPEACRMAVACGASKAMHRGPGIVTRDEIWQLMEDVSINSV